MLRINRLLENSLRLSEIGTEAQQTAPRNRRNDYNNLIKVSLNLKILLKIVVSFLLET